MNKLTVIMQIKDEKNQEQNNQKKNGIEQHHEHNRWGNKTNNWKAVEEFHGAGLYESGKHTVIEVTFQNANSMEKSHYKHEKKLKDEEEIKNIWVRRCMSKKAQPFEGDETKHATPYKLEKKILNES